MKLRIGLVLGLAALMASGCAMTGSRGQHTGASTPAWGRESNESGEPIVKLAPGVVEYVWEEPMVDVVDVPPGLDPEGTYYRPAHRSVVEVRQGKWQKYDDTADGR